MEMNSWRSYPVIPIEYIALLLAGIDPLEVDANRVRIRLPISRPNPFRTDVMAVANEKELPGTAQAKQWYGRIKQAFIDGEIHPAGEIRLWNSRQGTWRVVGREGLKLWQGFEFDMTRPEVARWLASLGWAESELPDFLLGIAPKPVASERKEGDELRALEALGLLAEALAQQHPGLYANNGKPKRSGINSIMQGVIEGYANPSDPEVEPIKHIGLGKTTLDETLKDAIEAWERRKQKA